MKTALPIAPPVSKPRTGSRHQPEQTRQAILDAAAAEFAAEGMAGARIDAIARGACVNKALLYYYFQDKETLYGAVLDRVFTGLRAAVEAQLDLKQPPKATMLACAAAHFDYIAGSPLYPRVMMREMMSAGRGGSPHIRRIAGQYISPMFKRLARVIEDGVAAGEFRPVDPMQFIPSMVALVVFYFSSTPVLRIISGADPLQADRVAARRAAVLDFISAALFTSQAATAPPVARPPQPKGVRP